MIISDLSIFIWKWISAQASKLGVCFFWYVLDTGIPLTLDLEEGESFHIYEIMIWSNRPCKRNIRIRKKILLYLKAINFYCFFNLEKGQKAWISFFCKLKKLKKTWISFFASLKNLKEHEFHFFCKLEKAQKHTFRCLQDWKNSKNVNFGFCKLKNFKKHEFHFFSS